MQPRNSSFLHPPDHLSLSLCRRLLRFPPPPSFLPDYLLDADYVSGQNITEHNPAPSPSGHPLLSGPPTPDLKTMFTR